MFCIYIFKVTQWWNKKKHFIKSLWNSSSFIEQPGIKILIYQSIFLLLCFIALCFYMWFFYIFFSTSLILENPRLVCELIDSLGSRTYIYSLLLGVHEMLGCQFLLLVWVIIFPREPRWGLYLSCFINIVVACTYVPVTVYSYYILYIFWL